MVSEISEIDRELAKQLEYIVRCICDYAKMFDLKSYQAYPYLRQSGGVDFLLNLLNDKVLCDRPLNEVLNDLKSICKVNSEKIGELGELKQSQEINTDNDEQREFESQVNGLITDVLLLLITDDGLTPLQALDYFYLSRTCRALERTETCLYYESPVYVWDFLHSEKNRKT